MPTVAVVGASADRNKFGNASVRAHRNQGWTVFPIHPSADEIEGLKAYASVRDVPEAIDRISVYLPPSIGLDVLDDYAAVPHDELFLNPGSESPQLIEAAKKLGLVPIVACSIVDVGESPATWMG